MTYDFSAGKAGKELSTGPISPYNWMSQCVRSYSNDVRKKVLLGLHFYGMKENEPITSDQFLTLVKHNPSMRASYDASTREHVFSWKEEGRGHGRDREEDARFPTVKSLAERMALAQSLGCAGVSIWELGQGMPMFMDLL
jgi:chitinase domain-containing protein 1